MKLENVWCKPEIESAHLQGKSFLICVVLVQFQYCWVSSLQVFAERLLPSTQTTSTCNCGNLLANKAIAKRFLVQYPLCNHFHANVFLRPLTNRSENELLSSFFSFPCNLCLPDDHWPVIRYVWLRPKVNRMQLSTV